MINLKKVDHFVITTEDLESCIAFYEALGFKSVCASGRYELFAGDFKINVHIRGSELLPHAQNVQPGSADFCMEIDGSLEETVRHLLEKGIRPESDIVGRHGVNGEMRSAYLRDPDGNLLEFCSYHKEAQR